MCHIVYVYLTSGLGVKLVKNPLPKKVEQRYQTIRQIGEGGMGAVYLAHDKVLDREVALKITRIGEDKEKTSQCRFRREISMLARVSNAHVVRLLDYEEEGNTLCYTMEYVKGASLRELAEERELSVDEAVGIAAQLADGVAAVHEAGVLHRDIKLENLVITADGILKLVDFGLAILDDESVTRLTEDGNFYGTVGYVAPELVLTGEAGEQSDVYQIGVVLYRLLTGKMPIPKERYLQVLADQEELNIVPPSSLRNSVDPHLDKIVMDSLRKEAKLRQKSASEFCDELGGWLQSNAFDRWQTVSKTITRKTVVKRNWLYAVVAACTLVLCIAFSSHPRKPLSSTVTPHQADVVKQKEEYLLHLAVQKADLAKVTNLLQSGAAIGRRDIKGNTPLHYAAQSGDLLLVRQLVRFGANTSARGEGGNTPLHLAAAAGDLDLVAELIKFRANPTLRNNSGETAFQLAHRLGHRAISSAERLSKFVALSLGEKESPLMNAVRHGDTALLRQLLENGAAVDELLPEGKRPLHVAVKKENNAVVAILVDGGASLDLTDDKGLTPLHLAAWQGNKAIVRFLLAKGAKRALKDKSGKRPADLAKEKGHTTVAALLGF